MKAIVTEQKEVEIKYLIVSAGVRYWEDATVNGVEDTDGELIPCRNNDVWEPKIRIDDGIIVNWKNGISADIHYKVCDAGAYYLLDENGSQVAKRFCYVPEILYPEGEGFGDYIIMRVDKNGQIANFDPRLLQKLIDTKSFNGY